MADVYIDVGPMAYSKDTTKVAANYTAKAKQLMRDATIKAIRASAGFTPDKTGGSGGYYFDATLTEITIGTYQGQPSVTCKVSGVVATFPQRRMLTQSLAGKTTLAGGASARDVEDCIRTVMEETTKKEVIPFLKRQ